MRAMLAVALATGLLTAPGVAAAQEPADAAPAEQGEQAEQGDSPDQAMASDLAIAATLVVDSTDDRPDTNPSDGVCRTSRGECTLRAAITQANANPGPDRIEFAIPGSGTKRISLGSSLPALNDSRGGTVIDGFTQPGARPNTDPRASNAVIRIEINGPENSSAMVVQSAENTIRGLAVYSSLVHIELKGEAADGNRIVGNHIGTNAAATYERSSFRAVGVLVQLGPDRNMIGTPALADRNVVSGTNGFGIRVDHGETSENRIQNNIIGLDPTGTRKVRQDTGIDLQWWTWGNLIGGYGPNEHNVISGSNNVWGGAVDLSHNSTGNLVIGNYLGTTLDGNGEASHTVNVHGIAIKDNAEGNYLAENIVAIGSDAGIWHKNNYSGPNTFVDNRVGVGINGGDIARRGGGDGMWLRGHDDVYHGNVFANIRDNYNVLISNTSIRNGAETWPDEQTLRNTVRVGSYYNNADAKPIEFGNTCCPHPDEDTPSITGLGPGEIYGGSTCRGCIVQVYVSGTVAGDGSLSPGNGTTGLGYIGSVVADSSGRYSMASPLITPGARVNVMSTTPSGESSDFMSSNTTIPSVGFGLEGDPDQPFIEAAPPALPLPTPYQPEIFECSFDGGVLSWTDAGASEYYVFAVNGGVESYLGGHAGTSLGATPADSYRVEHWVRGIATNATCDGPGNNPGPFTCSVANGVLSWTDVGAAEYYVFANNGGTETYLGGHATNSLNVTPADSYRVEHWLTGQVTNATCDGEGQPPGDFTCSVANGVLSWTDVGAAEYYVFANNGGTETYLGGHATNSLNVTPADSYRVEHWLSGQVTNATCEGEGGGPGPFTCSVANGVLSWTDVGAAEYYVFANNGGTETYLGGHATNSLNVTPADSYRVEHWLTGQVTNATCP